MTKLVKPSMWVQTDFVPGTHIDDACSEALRLAKYLHVGIEFPFNGMRVLVFPDTSLAELKKNTIRMAHRVGASLVKGVTK